MRFWTVVMAALTTFGADAVAGETFDRRLDLYGAVSGYSAFSNEILVSPNQYREGSVTGWEPGRFRMITQVTFEMNDAPILYFRGKNEFAFDAPLQNAQGVNLLALQLRSWPVSPVIEGNYDHGDWRVPRFGAYLESWNFGGASRGYASSTLNDRDMNLALVAAYDYIRERNSDNDPWTLEPALNFNWRFDHGEVVAQSEIYIRSPLLYGTDASWYRIFGGLEFMHDLNRARLFDPDEVVCMGGFSVLWF